MAVIAVATERPDDICRIVREEYERMPRMRLTLSQFRRVWHLSEREGAYVLQALLAAGVLADRRRGLHPPGASGRPPRGRLTTRSSPIHRARHRY